MNGIMNKTREWYCHICDETSNVESKVKHIISKTHKHKEKNGIVVKEYEHINPDIDEVIYILNDTSKDCRERYFHSIENRCVYDITYTNITKNEEVILLISIG